MLHRIPIKRPCRDATYTPVTLVHRVRAASPAPVVHPRPIRAVSPTPEPVRKKAKSAQRPAVPRPAAAPRKPPQQPALHRPVEPRLNDEVSRLLDQYSVGDAAGKTFPLMSVAFSNPLTDPCRLQQQDLFSLNLCPMMRPRMMMTLKMSLMDRGKVLLSPNPSVSSKTCLLVIK